MKRHLKAKKIIDEPKRSSKHSVPLCRSQFDSSSSSHGKEPYKRSTPLLMKCGNKERSQPECDDNKHRNSRNEWPASVSDIMFSCTDSLTDDSDSESGQSFDSIQNQTNRMPVTESVQRTIAKQRSIFERLGNCQLASQLHNKKAPLIGSKPPEVGPKTPENDIFESLFDGTPLEARIEFGDFPKEMFHEYSKKSRKKLALNAIIMDKKLERKKIFEPGSDELTEILKNDKRIENLKKSECTLDRLVFACEIVRISNWTIDLRWNNVPNSKGYLYMFITKHYPKVRILVTRDHSETVSEVFLAFSLCSPTKFAIYEQNLHINFDHLDIISIMFKSKPICHAFLGMIEFSNQLQLESALLDATVRMQREKAFVQRGIELMKYVRSGYAACPTNRGIVTNALQDRDRYHNRLPADNRFFSLFCNRQNYSTFPTK